MAVASQSGLYREKRWMYVPGGPTLNKITTVDTLDNEVDQNDLDLGLAAESDDPITEPDRTWSRKSYGLHPGK